MSFLVLVQLSSSVLLPYRPNLPLLLTVIAGPPKPSQSLFPLQSVSLISIMAFSFLFFAFLVKALLTQKPSLPVVLEESHCNEKQRSSINTTTCSAGTISYLLLNDLIGSGLVGEIKERQDFRVGFGLVEQIVSL